MIRSFQCVETRDLFDGKRVARFVNIETVAVRKLQQLHAATSLGFLRTPPGNRLEPLRGDRCGQYSIRINAQWRICFYWNEQHTEHVAIIDYH